MLFQIPSIQYRTCKYEIHLSVNDNRENAVKYNSRGITHREITVRFDYF